jgi:long-chain acyl-CoA synthetase
MIKFNTLGNLLLYRIKASKHDKSIGWISNSKINFMSYNEYYNKLECICLALNKIGLKKNEKVAIFANTSKDWHLLDFSLILSSAITVPIYPTYKNEDILYIYNHSECSALIIDGQEKIQNIINSIKKFKKIKYIITIDELDTDTLSILNNLNINCYSLDEIFRIGFKELKLKEINFESQIENLSETDIISIIYTSGTTGKPKGAIIDQIGFSSMLHNIASFSNQAFSSQDRTLTFLPLAHVFGRMDSYLPLVFGHQMIFAQSTETIFHDLLLVQPTFMCSVPRIFEKIFDSINSHISNSSFFRKKILTWSFNNSKNYFEQLDNDKTPSILNMAKYKISKKLILDKIYEKFGGKIKFFISGGAPLSEEIINFMQYTNLTILEGYGLTETIAPCTVNPVHRTIPGTVGLPIGDFKIKIDKDGELLVKSKSLFRGYYKDRTATQNVFTKDWLKTGDLAQITKDGYLKIIGRKKNIIITSGGKNISPQKIENLMKEEEFISEFICFGDNKKYLVGIVCIEKESFINILPQTTLDINCTIKDLSEDDYVKDLIQKSIDNVNNKLPKYETIKNFYVLPIDISISDQLITPSLKVKKNEVFKKFKNEILELYK